MTDVPAKHLQKSKASKGGGRRLSDEAKAFVIERLAQFETPAEVRRQLKAEFGIELSDNGVRHYAPDGPKGGALSEKWRQLHDQARALFLKEVSHIGISHRVVRLRALDRMAAKAEAQGNLALAAQMLEQAAKEMGDHYTNTRVIRGDLQVSAPKSLAEFYGRPRPVLAAVREARKRHC